jgi:hypothetical protein
MAFISFSGQFGGRGASGKILPYFWGLKLAAEGVEFEGFPFPELAFILRVDGEVSQFGDSGPNNLKMDRNGEYLSVDLGLTLVDQDNIEAALVRGLEATPEAIKVFEFKRKRRWRIDHQRLQAAISVLVARFLSQPTALAPKDRS